MKRETCAAEGCTHRATHGLKISLWARGFPKTTRPITLWCDLGLCHDHAKLATAADMLADPDTRARIQNALLGRGRAECDFDSGEVEPERLADVRAQLRNAMQMGIRS